MLSILTPSLSGSYKYIITYSFIYNFASVRNISIESRNQILPHLNSPTVVNDISSDALFCQ